MVKCKDCGFLAVWLRLQNKFEEASDLTRTTGWPPETTVNNEQAFHVKCFIQKYDLVRECKAANPIDQAFSFDKRVFEVVNIERQCTGHTEWLQGFSPKEHQEMIDRKSERRWRIAEGLIFAVTGAVVGSLVALVPQWAAKPVIPVVNISPPAVTVTSPQINVTVQPTEDRSIPPKTKHGPKSQLP